MASFIESVFLFVVSIPIVGGILGLLTKGVNTLSSHDVDGLRVHLGEAGDMKFLVDQNDVGDRFFRTKMSPMLQSLWWTFATQESTSVPVIPLASATDPRKTVISWWL